MFGVTEATSKPSIYTPIGVSEGPVRSADLINSRVEWSRADPPITDTIYPPRPREVSDKTRRERAALIARYGGVGELDGRTVRQYEPWQVFHPLADVFFIQDQGLVDPDFSRVRIKQSHKIEQFAIDQELTAAHEHAAKAPIATLHGSIDPATGTMLVEGYDMRQATDSARRQVPDDERVAAERQGIEAVYTSLQQGDQVNVIISPTKIKKAEASNDTEYGLAFIFTPKSTDAIGQVEFEEKIIMYPEAFGANDVSKDTLIRLLRETDQPVDEEAIKAMSTTQLVAQPFQIPKGSFLHEQKLEQFFALSPAEVQFSAEFKTRLSEVMGAELRAYGQLLDHYADLTPGSSEAKVRTFVDQAATLKNSIYTFARELAQAMRSGDYAKIDALQSERLRHTSTLIQDTPTMQHQPYEIALAWAARQQQLIGVASVGSTSCPMAYGAIPGAEQMGGLSVTAAMGLGSVAGPGRGMYRPETRTHHESYQCPNPLCRGWIDGESKDGKGWKDECPHCKNKVSCKKT